MFHHIEPVVTFKKYIYWELMNIVIFIGFTLDPIIYVFLTKHYRKLIVAKFLPCCGTVHRDMVTFSQRNVTLRTDDVIQGRISFSNVAFHIENNNERYV